jgi:phospholipid/cholesterol/gamma-HCH transport system permease protein
MDRISLSTTHTGILAAQPASLAVERAGDGTLVLRLGGDWLLREGVPSNEAVRRELESPPRPQRLAFDSSALGAWDTGLLTFLTSLRPLLEEHRFEVEREGLPEGVTSLIALAEAVPEKSDARAEGIERGVLERIGESTLEIGESLSEQLEFVGASAIAFGRMLIGKARYRRSELLLQIQQAGVEALPIVALVSFLLGLILAFVGAIQLQAFGAQIYVANLVGIAMARDMGALIAAIVMAGRSGGAYAAQLGSMNVNQEIDALQTTGISPLEFLVLPRMTALFLMMPLLSLYAAAVGILGGAAVGTGMLDLSLTTYYQQTVAAISLRDVLGGVMKGATYGILIALAGCLRGMQSGRSASAVGDAATSAVVTAIVAIIAAAGIYSAVFYVMGW